MEEEGLVRSVRDGELMVEILRPAACSSCAARGACMTLAPRRRVIRVRSDGQFDPRQGDRVRLQIRTVTFLRATFLGYLVPTLAFFAGVAAVLVAVPSGQTVMGLARDIAAFVAGAAGVALSFLGLWIAGSRSAARQRYAPRIVAVLKESDPGG